MNQHMLLHAAILAMLKRMEINHGDLGKSMVFLQVQRLMATGPGSKGDGEATTVFQAGTCKAGLGEQQTMEWRQGG